MCDFEPTDAEWTQFVAGDAADYSGGINWDSKNMARAEAFKMVALRFSITVAEAEEVFMAWYRE
jgi:hypothetical protein